MVEDPTVLITGGGGQVGRALRGLLATARFATRDELDVSDAGAVDQMTKGVSIVVHLAAMTNVDRCEADPVAAAAVNDRGSANVASSASRYGARVIYTSTDYVFDGTKTGAYTESDAASPINVYGTTKLAGERHVSSVPGSLVIRTSWVYGDGRNFVRTVLGAARSGRPLRVVDDQIGRPTAAVDIAEAIVHAIRTEASGIVHLSGDGPPASWADVAQAALEAAGINAPLERVSTADYIRGSERVVARRPSNSVLSLDRAKELGLPIADWRDSLKDYVEAIA
ncbi:MAG: dTDP-4-dehydrorhamnose reductase [Actinomycetota bacterium]|nr:dTDP-4-dehydrorhamnose reductase [Actinomycetota bacterium]